MAFIGKTYKHDRDEGFKEFLEHIGVPEDTVTLLIKSKPSVVLEKSSDEYVLTTKDAMSTKELKFKLGDEFEVTVTPNLSAKTTFTLDGNILKQAQTFPDGRTLFTERHFGANELTVILKSTVSDMSARRTYVAA